MDKIYIHDLMLRCIIGIYPQERSEKQDVVVNVAMECDLARAGQTDRIEDTVDYESIKKEIIRLVEGSSFNLIEKLAAEVAQVCLAAAGVRRVTVTVDKPGALRFTRSVAVEITREA
jgi:D-erythro-7,8-dihydroneopterin triphosphate epimerase